jgi:hypothetical protein
MNGAHGNLYTKVIAMGIPNVTFVLVLVIFKLAHVTLALNGINIYGFIK